MPSICTWSAGNWLIFNQGVAGHHTTHTHGEDGLEEKRPDAGRLGLSKS